MNIIFILVSIDLYMIWLKFDVINFTQTGLHRFKLLDLVI